MKLTAKLSPLAIATTLAITSLAAPVASYAEVSSTATLSSMYLWRGQDISGACGQLAAKREEELDIDPRVLRRRRLQMAK